MKKWFVVLLSSVVITAIHLAVLSTEWGDRFEYLGQDFWYSIRGPVKAPSDIVIISMDEASYTQLNIPMHEAWPRALHAQLVEKLAEYKVKRVVFDILFLGSGAKPESDEKLWTAIQKVPTVLGADTGSTEQGGGASHRVIENLNLPYEPFAEVAEKVALVKMPDDNGFIRRFSIPRSHLTREMPTLYEAAIGVNHNDAGQPGERDLLWYYGEPGRITTLPYHQVLDSAKLPADILKDKIVFVGLNLRSGTGPMEKDSYKIPFNHKPMFGMEIQATAAANVLEKKWVRRYSTDTETLCLGLATLILTISVFAVKPQWGAAIVALVPLAWSISSYYAFNNGVFIPGLILVSAALPLSYLISTLSYYVITYRAQRRIQKAFELYLPPEMARVMGSDPKALELGGEDVWATALFTDIAGFTNITEGITATEVSTMLSSYFTEVVRVVFGHQGTLLKFIGDAVFVIWGAPIKINNHASLACRTALDIQEEITRFNATKKFPPLNTRVGIHTGSMVVGNMGSAERLDYTALGDTVNLASRLEGLNKHFGTSILVSGSTHAEVPEDMGFLPLGSIRAAGKTEATQIFGLLPKLPNEDALKSWKLAHSFFKARQWEEAASAFELAAQQDAMLLKASHFYREQVSINKEEPPTPGWSGEITFSSK